MTDPLEQLLVVQGHDLRVTQLGTRRAGLPERAEVEAVAASEVTLAEQVATLDRERHRLEREQTRIADEIASLEAKSTQVDASLYSGTVTNPRELQGLQDEVAALARRVGELEDEELELMVARDPLDEQASALEEERRTLAEQREDLTRRITVAEAEIDAEVDAEQTARAAAAAAVPDDLLADYERIRGTRAGIGIARLEHGTCQGCHIKLSAVELDRIKGLPDDARITCEECGRILVR